MLLKTRKAKNSARGIYIQDRQLQETVFAPGTHYKYVVDVANQKVVILASDEDSNTVSKRQKEASINPVIDIRSKEALSAFEGCDYLQVEIHNDQIVVSGYVESKETLVSKVKRTVKKAVRGSNNVHSIHEFLNVEKRAEIVLSKRGLSRAVGDYEQLTLFPLDELDEQIGSQSVKTALENINVLLQVDSLFSGAGFLDLGFIKNGFTVAFAIEKNPDAVMTYRANLGNHIMEADVQEINKQKFFKSPVMIGGSPCQGLSNSNRNTNFLDNPNNKLVKEYIEAVRSNENCKVFVLENVPQILSAGGQAFKNEILEALSDFEVSYGVLNSADYGSSQIRKRAIFIGSKIGRIELPEPEYRPMDYRTVRYAFQGLHDGVPNQMDVSVSKPITLERIRSVPVGGNVHDIPESIRPKGQHSDMYKRLKYDEPSVTIVNPRKAMLLHPEEDRILSIRECARLQGVDDDFTFHGNLNSKQQQVANGVPVHLAKAIARVIKNAILKFNIRNRKTALAW